jgi:hypothetical protein
MALAKPSQWRAIPPTTRGGYSQVNMQILIEMVHRVLLEVYVTFFMFIRVFHEF